MALDKFNFEPSKSFKKSLEEIKESLDFNGSLTTEKEARLEGEVKQLKEYTDKLLQELQEANQTVAYLHTNLEGAKEIIKELQEKNEALRAEYDKLYEAFENYVEEHRSAAPAANGSDNNANTAADDNDSPSFSDLEVARPSVRLADVAGMEEVKNQIRLRLIEPLRHPERFQKYGLESGGGICLYGPPGTGKTFIAQAVAGELGLPFLAISGADLKSPYYSESVKNVKNLFEKHLAKYDTSILFIDEMESLFRSRSDGQSHEASQEIVTTFLQYIDGMKGKKNSILFLGATNAPYMLDEAVLRPGRFGEMFYVGLPDFQARLQILKSCAAKSNIPWENGVFEYAAEQMELFSGADIKGWVIKLMQIAFDKNINVITRGIVKECLRDARPSINSDTMKRIQEWEAAHNLPVHNN